MVVDLIKGGRGEPEGQAAELILNVAVSIKGVVDVPQNHVAGPGIYVMDHGGDGRDGSPQQFHQFFCLGEGFAGGNNAHHELSGDLGLPHIDVADVSPPSLLIVGENVILPHPPEHRFRYQLGLLGLDVAMGNGD